jgi:hypothetical protein
MSRTVRGGVVALLCAGCGSEELPGEYFDLVVTTTQNECTGNGLSYSGGFEYRVLLDGNDATISVVAEDESDDVFAVGTLDGCNLSYTSLVWSTYLDEGDLQKEVKWQIQGAAAVNMGGGGGCVEQVDWEGTENIQILASAHSAIAPGCLYEMSVTGSWLRAVP